MSKFSVIAQPIKTFRCTLNSQLLTFSINLLDNYHENSEWSLKRYEEFYCSERV